MSYRVLCFSCLTPFVRPPGLAPELPATHCPGCVVLGRTGMEGLERMERRRLAARSEVVLGTEAGKRKERHAAKARRRRGVETIRSGLLV